MARGGGADSSFHADADGLAQGLAALLSAPRELAREKAATDALRDGLAALPAELPDTGLGERAVLERLAPLVLGGAQPLGGATSLAHMDPPTPWIAWVLALWNASRNQNLLHPDLSPAAREIESLVVRWLAPAFGMEGGHLTSGSSLASLTALWAARELAGVRTVVASEASHLSVGKSAHILGLEYVAVPVDDAGALDTSALPTDLSAAALVLTAGTTSTGAVDDLALAASAGAAWCHVDAAWAGPLALSPRHAAVLDGVTAADSVALSPHKWLWQPKDAGLVLFRDAARAHAAVSYNGAYLAVPNVGVAGSRGAAGATLLATLLSWGRDGVAERLDRGMALADELARRLDADPRAELFAAPRTGVLLWRPADGEAAAVRARLPAGMASSTILNNREWIRQVAANPSADIDAIWAAIEAAL